MGKDSDKTNKAAENQKVLSELAKVHLEATTKREKKEKGQSRYEFSLHISNEQEMIFRHNKNDIFDRASAGAPKTTFFLTSALLRHFYGLLANWDEDIPTPSPEDVYVRLKYFYMEVSGQRNILDKAIPVDIITDNLLPPDVANNTELYETTNFLAEIHTFVRAIKFWLHPKRGQEVIESLFKNPWTEFTGVFCRRCREFRSWPILCKDKLEPVYESDGILPLCWAEIWYAIDHKIKAGLCPYCWDVFVYPSNNYQKAHCGRDECKRAHVIKQHGGEEGYRKWESSRKKPADGEKRKRGRPKKLYTR